MPEALEYERVLLQPTHLIYSEDYDRVREDAAPFQSRFRSLAVGRPLIADTGDLPAPLMLTAGRHALRDMSGSWKERLETERAFLSDAGWRAWDAFRASAGSIRTI